MKENKTALLMGAVLFYATFFLNNNIQKLYSFHLRLLSQNL